MGIVSEYVRSLVARQVNNHGLVIWYDPETHYGDLIAMLPQSDTTVAVYGGSYFALRQSIDSVMDKENPPRLVVYVPLEPVDTHSALVELTTAGVTLRPGQQSPSRNTRLSIIARNALKDAMTREAISSIEKQADEGKLTLAELRLAFARHILAAGLIHNLTGELSTQLATVPVPDKEAVREACASLAKTWRLRRDLRQSYLGCHTRPPRRSI